MPIKTKTVEENFRTYNHVYFNVWSKEFVNSICDELLRNIGTENLVTSSYHPRTNIWCEKENQTLLRALRKHANKNPLEWHKWLPYCLMAYRDTVHSTTGFTSYELLFGRPMNKFVDYIIDEKQVKQSEITNRLTEIKICLKKMMNFFSIGFLLQFFFLYRISFFFLRFRKRKLKKDF